MAPQLDPGLGLEHGVGLVEVEHPFQVARATRSANSAIRCAGEVASIVSVVVMFSSLSLASGSWTTGTARL